MGRSLLGSVPAVDRDDLAGDERCARGTQPEDGAGNLLGLADASDGMRGLQHLLDFRRSRKVMEHSRLDRSWSHGIDANILLRVFERDRFRQPDDGVFAGSVNRSCGKAEQPGDGSVVDDCTAAGFQHRRNLVLERQPNALDVDVHDLVVRLFGLIRQRCQRLLDAGVVEGAIEPAEFRQRPLDHRLDIALLRDVGLDEDRLAPRRLDLCDDCTAFLLAASADDDLRALSGKLYCGRTADPGIAAGDQDDPSRKLTHDTLPPLKLLGSVPRGSGLTPMRGSNVSRAIAGRFMVPLSTTASSREASRPRLADSTMPPAIGAFRGRRRRASRRGGFAIIGSDAQGRADAARYTAHLAADRWQERNP